jgi:uncharacterized membrane protein YdfJ with MMPL/SSD domain
MEPELLMVEADHDLRNPADMLVLDRIARGVFHIPGIARVQNITRPLGTPIDHSSIPFQISMQSSQTILNLKYMHDAMDNLGMPVWAATASKVTASPAVSSARQARSTRTVGSSVTSCPFGS